MDRKDLFILLLILIPSFLLRLYNLDFHNGETVFDEKVYYHEAALSYLKNQDDPNFEHPPLGKEILALGIKIFGDNPYGWRALSVLFSLLSIIVIYFFFKNLFQSRLMGTLTGVFLSLDFMYFIHSRLGTMEIFYLFFGWTSMYFFWKFIQAGGGKSLIFSVLFFSLALSTKWTAVLFALPFLLILIRRRSYGQLARWVITTALVSLTVYLLVYLPYLQRHSIYDWTNLQIRIANHWATFAQRTTLKITPTQYFLNHAFAWPLNPAWAYDFIKGENGSLQVAWAMYNPVLFFASLLLLVKHLIKKSFRGFFNPENLPILVVFSMFLPWLFVTRVQYTYYFLPALPFLYSLFSFKLVEILRKDRWNFASVILSVALIFAYFYPLISGVRVPSWYLILYPLAPPIETASTSSN